MKEIDATRLKLKCMEMVEGTDLDWWKVIRLHDDGGYISAFYSHPPTFGCPKDQYKLAIGIIEGNPVWEGDEYYLGHCKCKASRIVEYTKEFWAKCSWNPPKPNTIPVEIPLETVEFLASFDIHGSNYLSLLTQACRKALEKPIRVGSATGCDVSGNP